MRKDKMIKGKIYLAAILLIFSLSSCEEFDREDNREPESAPQSFSAISDTYGKVFLTWNIVRGAAEYEVFYSTDDDSSNATSLISTNRTSFDTSLTPGASYSFWIKAKNGTAATSYSSIASVTVKNTVSVPTSFSVTSNRYREVSLTWDIVKGATSYNIYYSENLDSLTANSLGSTELTKFDKEDLPPGKFYYFWVQANNGIITSVVSSEKRVKISGMETVRVEGGTFRREGGFNITVSSFYMGTYEVTQKQWLDITEKNPSNNQPQTGWYKYPVENVNWYDAVEFCNKLSEAEGFDPVYVINKGPHFWRVDYDFNKNGYRLPTEAEWEYAARGGENEADPSFTYSGSNTIGDVAWYSDNSGHNTHEVGGKKPNALELYDMSGNVMEWCWDGYDNTYPSGNQTNPAPTGPSNSSRVLRGGSYSYDAYYNDYCGVVTRNRASPFEKFDYDYSYKSYNYYGFRVVRSILPR